MVYSISIVNAVLGVASRICQIVYYCKTDFIDGTETARNVALTFCILPSAINLFMILIYVIFHNEEMHTVQVKIKNFFIFLFSMEFLVPYGVHYSFKTKYSFNADNIVVTMKVVNASHAMFVAIPQILIVSIYSSATDKFEPEGIASIVCSTIFLVWCVAFYFICSKYDEDLDDYAQEKCIN